MRELIFVDTETTGLDPENDELVELTYARRTGDPYTLYFGVKVVPPFINELIRFDKRGIAGRMSTNAEITDFLKVSEGATMVAANPSFDMAFIKNAGLWQFHYRMLDIESYAMGVLGKREVPGLNSIFNDLKNKGYDLTEPDHTSRNDVLALREVFLILETE